MCLPAPVARERVVAAAWHKAEGFSLSGHERARARLLLLASPTSYRVGAYRDAAKSIDIDLLVGSEGECSLVSQSADGISLPLGDPDGTIKKILKEASRQPFDGVVAADDATVEITSRVAAALGLAHNPLEAARVSRRKDLGRKNLYEAGLPVPQFLKVDLTRELLTQIDAVTFPCVVKPLSLSASRGVIRANNQEELAGAVGRLRDILSNLDVEQERRFILVEDYIPGTEIAVEGLLRDGVLEVLAIFDKPDVLEGPFFEETYYVTPSRHSPSIQERIGKTIALACQAYGLTEGPIHAEARLWENQVWVLEIAARTIGGDCARLLQFGTGYSLEALVLSSAAGRPLKFETVGEAAGVMMLPILESGCLRRVEGVLEARRTAYIEDVVIAVREGYELVPLPEGSSYLGFLFARGPDPELVEAALRKAYSKLDVVVSPIWRVEAGTISSHPGRETRLEDHRTRPLQKESRACVSR